MFKKYCTVQVGKFSYKKIRKGRCRDLECDYHTKPEYGLWASLYTNEMVSEWYQLISKDRDFNKDNYSITIFELNDNAKILEILTEEDITNFEKKYYQEFRKRSLIVDNRIYTIDDTEFINWDKVFKDYDALYVDSSVANSKCFYDWLVDTLYISNKNAIKKDSIAKIK